MTDEEKKLIQIESRIQEEYFVKLYDSVLFDKRLSSNDKILLCFYIKVGGQRNFSWYGIKKIAELLGLNEKTIRTCNRTLRELGYIETVFRTANTPYKIIVNSIPQINGFDIIRESEEGKNYHEEEGKNSPCGKNYHARAVKNTAPVRENLPPKKNNITRLNELEYTHTSVSEEKENFGVCFFQKCVDLTKLPVSELNQIPYFKSQERRDEVARWESMILEAGINYKALIREAGESVKNSSPANRFLNFINTFRILVSEKHESLIKAQKIRELKNKARAEELELKQEQEARDEREAQELGITTQELKANREAQADKEWDEAIGHIKKQLKDYIDEKNQELIDYGNSVKVNEAGMPIFKSKELNENVKHYLELEKSREKITKEEAERLLKRVGLK